MGKVKDPSLAGQGRLSYEWASMHMPILTRTIEKLEKEKPLDGIKVALCLHITKETSVLAMGVKRLGADVSLAAANPLSTQDDIAAFLNEQGIDVYAWRGESNEEYMECIRSVLRKKPDIITDDGSDTHSTLHAEDEFKDLMPIGGTEETTTGVIRLKALENDGLLRYPVIAVNNAYTKHLFDNRYGTGQSTIDGILRATSLLIAGKTFVVCGYGWVGKGIAARARGMNANVIVTEVDPIKALEAHMDGFRVMPIDEAVKEGDMFVTATGQTGVIQGKHIEHMKDGAILANAGHFDVEIDVKYLDTNASKRKVREHLEEYTLKNGKRVYLIGRGRIANLVAAEGHPPEVMALSFSNQLLAMVYLTKNKNLEKRVYNMPKEIDEQVATNALEAMNVRIDKPTEEQLEYAKSWKL
ncbi:MAG: S-adenosyl-L-homocysteine hydrolase [Candidatus Nitrosocaldaceae archaeon]|nr:MAG: S-adenosyl-L-homocysteine hydrolase [Candidatus Nitrosocaldaceae archaeon]